MQIPQEQTELVADAARRGAARSPSLRSLLGDLLTLTPAARRDIIDNDLTKLELAGLYATSQREMGTAYALWQGDPVGFVTHVLDEAIWSGQARILNSIADHQITAVPSCFSSGKTRTAALAALYWTSVYPPGTSIVVTLAPRWRQVIRQVWPEIRRAVTRAGLPGQVDTAQWKLPDPAGLEHVVAYGIAAAPQSEDAVQGIHAASLLLVVDEAGGIAPVIGRNLAGLLTGSNSRMLSIGNPPTDDEGGWFERLCDSERANVIRVGAESTPNFTGEKAPRCKSCPKTVPAHSIAKHLIDRQWVAEAIGDHGADSRYVTAKVKAEFPHGGPSTLIPAAWVEAAVEADEPDAGPEAVALSAFGLPEETGRWRVKPGAWVRLGVDVAADGGDELAIARAVGGLVTIEHTSAGPDNANAVDVSGKILVEIRRAEALARALGTLQRVRVKIDVIGVGWGVASVLERWGQEGKHSAEIVRVDVRESPGRPPDAPTLRPARKRDEMWLAGRTVLTPNSGQAEPIRLRVDARTAAQLSAPRYATNSSGETVVESKDAMRKRSLRSPDRAEGVLLAVYEPAVRRARLIA